MVAGALRAQQRPGSGWLAATISFVVAVAVEADPVAASTAPRKLEVAATIEQVALEAADVERAAISPAAELRSAACPRRWTALSYGWH